MSRVDDSLSGVRRTSDCGSLNNNWVVPASYAPADTIGLLVQIMKRRNDDIIFQISSVKDSVLLLLGGKKCHHQSRALKLALIVRLKHSASDDD
eukprot:scaffold5158_cov29-Attheya_sp.AAC.1